ncbi:MAG: hypothetical protein ABIH00_03890 [Armatimonadota bacterium]
MSIKKAGFVITANEVGKLMDLTPKSANALIGDFERISILKEITGQERNRIFEFKEYLALFKKE